MLRSSRMVLAMLLMGTLATVWAADAKEDHAVMKKEHAKVHAEHDLLLKQLSKWKIEHTEAFAALREIEASILDHEATLQELAEHAREHEDHIQHHEEEFAEHEQGGNDKDHAKMAETHKKLLEEHAKISKQVGEFHDDHDALMASLKKLRDSLKKH